jgi:hypothetical protein
MLMWPLNIFELLNTAAKFRVNEETLIKRFNQTVYNKKQRSVEAPCSVKNIIGNFGRRKEREEKVNEILNCEIMTPGDY